MAGKGGGAWKVAYADFVTAMMAFFLVMWIVGQSKAVKQAVAQYFNEPSKSKAQPKERDGDPLIMPGKPGDGSSLLRIGDHASAGNRLLPDFKKERGQGGKGEGTQKPSVLVLHDGDRRSAGTVVLFAEASAELDDAARQRLKDVVPMLLGKRNKLEIRGHASRRPLPPAAPFQDAWQLSYARCVAVREYLEKAGIEPERIRLAQAGVFEPHTIRPDPESLAQNSRVELTMLAEFVEDSVGTTQERAERFNRSAASAKPVLPVTPALPARATGSTNP